VHSAFCAVRIEKDLILPKLLAAAGERKYTLVVEGTDLRSVLTTPGVDGYRTESNHIMEVASVLGIEAARSKIMSEIKYIFDQYGMGIDYRHVMLLADLMTFKGVVLGITRFGIVDMKESILHSASFERTTDQLFEAAAKGMEDHVSGVSESIILGLQMPIGTGLFSLRHIPDTDLSQGRPPPVMAS
jgi:DNA-directed RNA polymerase III subunit RPC1